MPDEQTPAGGGTPPAPVTPPPAVVTPPASTPETISLTSEQLKKRLDEASASAQRKYLKSLGFEKDDDLSAALKRLKETDDASKTEHERLKTQLDELSPKAARAAQLEEQIAAIAEEQFKGFPENIQDAIDEIADGDAEDRMTLMSLLRKVGVGAATAAPVSTVTPPANASPSPAPPASGAPTKFQEWESMKTRSPMLGDIFYQQNQREIERTRPA
jgi:hypothetical protein